jgi:hypothetical protein
LGTWLEMLSVTDWEVQGAGWPWLASSKA